MIKTVIFDLDGLLIKSEIVSYELYCLLLKQYGHDFELEDYSSHYSGGTAVGNMNAIIERFNLPVTCEEGLGFIREKEVEYVNKGIPLHEGARELLDYLKEKHYTIILGSSSVRERALKTLNIHGIMNYFQDYAFGPEVKRGKPYPDIFLKAIEKSNCKNEECLILEDSENGILAASRAGAKVICIPDLKKPSSEFANKCECVLDSLKDVIDYLETNQG